MPYTLKTIPKPRGKPNGQGSREHTRKFVCLHLH